MSTFIQRITLLLLAVILQRSFFDVLWPSLIAPALIISVVVSLVFLLGFEHGLPWVFLTLFLFTLLGEVGIFPVFAVGVAYGTSFLSRRLLIEHHVESSLALAMVTAAAAAAYVFVSIFLYGSSATVGQVIGGIFEAFLIFPLVLIVLRFSEEHIRSSQMAEFRGLRTQ
ncbi:MAG: hypothetical protein WAT81_00915 [Candidatus Moraniibacteriota bacterium]